MKNSTLIIATLLFLGACSKVDKAQTSIKNMEERTTELKHTTDNIDDIAKAIFPQLRSGDSATLRLLQFEKILDKKVKIGSKTVAAATYFQAMEYQFWIGNNTFDNKGTLDHMYRDAVDEFQGRLYDLYEEINPEKMSPINKGQRHNEEMAFYALAHTLDRTHQFRKSILVRFPHVRFSSFLDLIKSALRKDKSGQNMEAWEEILMAGINKEIMIELIKKRVDIYSAIALKDLSEQREMTLTQKSKAALFLLTGGHLSGIELPETYDSSNKATKNVVQDNLEMAMEAKKFLQEIEVDHQVEKKVRSALRKIDFNEKEDDQDKSDKKKEGIRTLINLLIE